MKTDRLSIRIDHDAKVAFSRICDEVGVSHSQAIQIFVKAVINHGGIPFEREVPQPNKTTIAAIQELMEGKGHTVESLNDGQNTGTDS